MTTTDDTLDDWDGGFAWSGEDDGYAYVPGEVLVRGDEALERTRSRMRGIRRDEEVCRLDDDAAWFRVGGDDDPRRISEEMTAEGQDVQPEHVFFAHGCCSPSWSCCGCGDGMAANPLKANPLKANPLKANPLKANRPLENTARPAAPPEIPSHGGRGSGDVRVLVLDSGLAADAPLFRGAQGRITGGPDQPDRHPGGRGDGWLDPVAGHGTFIAGIVEQLAPGCTITVRRVFTPSGVVREGAVAVALYAAAVAQDPPHLVCLSFGGSVSRRWSELLYEVVAFARRRGIVIVASAGNDASCVPQFPAAVPGVIAVGALDVDGPAWFSNRGDWVDASAPGVDVVSAFFQGFNGRSPEVNGVDPDDFQGWARWSGTSFAAPVVVAALARELAAGRTPGQAVRTVVDAPHLFRLPCFGTVVNL